MIRFLYAVVCMLWGRVRKCSIVCCETFCALCFFLRCKAPVVEPLPEDAGGDEHKARLDCCATVAMCTTCFACISNAAID